MVKLSHELGRARTFLDRNDGTTPREANQRVQVVYIRQVEPAGGRFAGL